MIDTTKVTMDYIEQKFLDLWEKGFSEDYRQGYADGIIFIAEMSQMILRINEKGQQYIKEEFNGTPTRK